MKEVIYIKLPEVSQEEYLQQIKDQLAVWDEEQRILGNKVRHFQKVVYGTPNE
jgi:hypothetical protein